MLTCPDIFPSFSLMCSTEESFFDPEKNGGKWRKKAYQALMATVQFEVLVSIRVNFPCIYHVEANNFLIFLFTYILIFIHLY